ncbi:uncharacterized protein CIMG_06791 [Coccidioides immitis RS]|uniref:Uncharacterized protein n=4 Tax=Coccidioides immitis TaxID=5501 RepID=J3K8X7_COCIM|nr:uncharacterized protein CIMG_06791 [Coccidioides immitis RS]EAS31312.3 hypothetical protein CIMG_06791 [Coccidioides immitis RS]KMP03945.1 hypothetical protein CIRG_03638 [Coccidioides immitis RMSCC 2394]KMU74922.1 hypothetical protein CISG_00851 [Coccidioides immitis RMSCC 3703]
MGCKKWRETRAARICKIDSMIRYMERKGERAGRADKDTGKRGGEEKRERERGTREPQDLGGEVSSTGDGGCNSRFSVSHQNPAQGGGRAGARLWGEALARWLGTG